MIKPTVWSIKTTYNPTQSLLLIKRYFWLAQFLTNWGNSALALTSLLLGQPIIKGLIQGNRSTVGILVRRNSLKKKIYVHKNYTTNKESTHVIDSKRVTQKLQFTKLTEVLFYQWFKLNSSTPSNFNQHLKPVSQSLIAPIIKSNECFNIKALFARWVNTFHLLYTLFTYKSTITIFSSPIFSEEVDTLNYYGSSLDYRLFRYLQPCFYYTEPSYGLNSLLVFTKLLKKSLEVGIITDINIHGKTLFYLQSINTYTIGLVPSNYKQWSLSYPIPTTLESFLAQYFFLKWLHLTKQTSINEVNTQCQHYWQGLLSA